MQLYPTDSSTFDAVVKEDRATEHGKEPEKKYVVVVIDIQRAALVPWWKRVSSAFVWRTF